MPWPAILDFDQCLNLLPYLINSMKKGYINKIKMTKINKYIIIY